MSLETQLVALATQIGTDIADLQDALNGAKADLQDLIDQIDASKDQPSTATMNAVTMLLSTGLGNPERDLRQAYIDAMLTPIE